MTPLAIDYSDKLPAENLYICYLIHSNKCHEYK